MTSGSYATIDDFETAGIPAAALASVPKTTVQRMLERASAEASAYLRDRYTLPLCQPYDPALVNAVCAIVAYRALTFRGLNPQMQGADYEVVKDGYDEAVRFLRAVANGQAALCVVQSQPPSLQPDVGTNPARGFGSFGLEPGTQDYPVVGGMGGGWGT